MVRDALQRAALFTMRPGGLRVFAYVYPRNHPERADDIDSGVHRGTVVDCTFPGSSFRGTKFVDCTFERCDLTLDNLAEDCTIDERGITMLQAAIRILTALVAVALATAPAVAGDTETCADAKVGDAGMDVRNACTRLIETTALSPDERAQAYVNRAT